ncbi:MAG: M20/M25/M40 family metallo-hydrolase [Bdellovibrionaceae bacterium]|nr:M20/M25/M40 family metallo-hydrolase [Pseudobdellovibrionaceae bacterium]MBX3034342.1 M20/M25/M40 family metallo-hydrolase [Pseudobdellovibrionaceae bacterium]
MILPLLPFALFAAPDDKTPTPSFRQEPNTIIQGARQLTFVGNRTGEGYFSADGKKMIFQSERQDGNPFYQMYLLDLASGRTDLISTGGGKTTCGWIHPTGRKVMWSSTHLDPHWRKKAQEEEETRKKPVKSRYSWSYDEHFDIFESDLRGKKIKRLTKEKGYDAEGSYSPDGRLIAFASNRAGYTEQLSPEDAKMFAQDPSFMMDIYIMDADGRNVKRLTREKGYDGGPFFSPDGRRITWRRFAPNGATAEIHTMNIDGTDQKRITHLNSMSWAPFYHPSGDYIIFAANVLGFANFELFIVDKEGEKTPLRVTFDDGFDGLATFTPDGTRISWTHRNEKGESQIEIASWDDAQARRLLGLPPRDPAPRDFHPEIRETDLRRLVEWMASEEMGGREAGSAEEKRLTRVLENLLRSWGLQGAAPGGSFLQRFEYTSAVKLGEKNRLKLAGALDRELVVGRDAEPYSLSATGELMETPVVFAGYGIKAAATDKQPEYNSYRDLDVKDKWALVLRDLPEDLPPERRHHLSLYSRLQHKLTVAREAGAKGVIVIESLAALKPQPDRALRFEGVLSTSSLPAWRVGGEWVKDLFRQASQDWAGVKKRLDAGEMVGFTVPSLYIRAHTDLVTEKSMGTNVIARLPGRRPGVSAVLLGAHGDHLGRGRSGSSLAKNNELGQVHGGADDNASGVAALLEIAHHLSQQKKPAQDVIFAVWSAEEIGLLGSSAYVKEWEKLRKKNLKTYLQAAINMDMVGRFKDRLQMQGVASGANWARLGEELTLKTGVPLSLTDDPYLPTDAMTFYMAGIPSISFFTGAHGEYHTPRDTADTINYQGLERVANLVSTLVGTLSSGATPLVKYRSVSGNPNARLEGRSFRVYLGTVPDYAQEGVRGVRLSGVSAGSPAEAAGLKEKDVIVEFNGTKIENIYDYVYTLQSVKPQVETEIKVRRGGETLGLRITPRLKD